MEPLKNVFSFTKSLAPSSEDVFFGVGLGVGAGVGTGIGLGAGAGAGAGEGAGSSRASRSTERHIGHLSELRVAEDPVAVDVVAALEASQVGCAKG